MSTLQLAVPSKILIDAKIKNKKNILNRTFVTKSNSN